MVWPWNWRIVSGARLDKAARSLGKRKGRRGVKRGVRSCDMCVWWECRRR